MTTIAFTLNGRAVRVATDGSRMLAHVLRLDLGLTGTKLGCGVGLCGACAVLVDGREMRSCSTPVADVAGRAVTTVEGLASGDALHPVQAAFLEHQAFQCGFCTSGQILNAVALLETHPRPDSDLIRTWMESNLCRCTGYEGIRKAIESLSS